jgi:hypothetical protein
VYYINVDENETKNKKLLKIDLVDYDKDTFSVNKKSEDRFTAQIVSGNAQGLFSISGLTLFTGSSARKLDRETRTQHELDIKIVEQPTNGNNSPVSNSSSRFTMCKLIINVNDINDNRPVVNDIELIIYNKLDKRLVEEMKIPIANAIAIDQDQIAKLSYSIVSVKVSTNESKRRRLRSHAHDYDVLENSNQVISLIKRLFKA